MPLFFVIGAFVFGYFAGKRGRADSPRLALASGSVGDMYDPYGHAKARAAGMPSPITALVGFLRSGAEPPPIVVQHAIAEAKSIGDHKLAHDLTHTFVEPQRPIIDVPAQRMPAAPPTPAPVAPPRHDDDRARDDRDERHREHRFEHRLEREIEREREIIDAQRAAAQAPPSDPSDPWAHIDPSFVQQLQDSGIPVPSYAAPTPAPQPRPDDGQGDDSDQGDASTSSQGSPLPGVSVGAWDEYRRSLEREPATHDSQRHVGRYRQNKERLRELGCDPAMLVAHPRALELQDAALAMDAVDSARHLAASGMLEHVGRTVALPDGQAKEITLSGLLGLAQVAGLEGAAGWLESHDDRKRFRHTTAGFVATNGVF